MEIITFFHGQCREAVEIAGEDGFLHSAHTGGNDFSCAVGEERGGGDGLLHACCTADGFLRGVGDEEEGAHVGPVGGRGNEVGEAVGAVWGGACVPGDVAAEEGAAGGAGALAGDTGEVFGWSGEGVEVGDGADEGGEACGAAGEAGGCGEVVGAGEA